MIQRKAHEGLETVGKSIAYEATAESSISDLLDEVELFDKLSDEDRKVLERNSSTIAFLAGDTIIGSHAYLGDI